MGSAISTQAFQAKIENFTDNDGNSFSQFLPAGVVLPFAVSTPPAGFLLCDGSTVSRTTYAKLFAAIGTAFGAGDGSTTFKLPDMRGVFPRGAGTNADANYGGVTGHQPAGGVVAAKGGQKTAKNGLSNANSGVSGTTNVSHTHGSSSISTSNTWDSNNVRINLTDRFNQTSYYGNNSAGSRWVHNEGGNNNYQFRLTVSGTAGGQSLGTSNKALDSGSATAQVISGDSETAPASLALNYIIKI